MEKGLLLPDLSGQDHGQGLHLLDRAKDLWSGLLPVDHGLDLALLDREMGLPVVHVEDLVLDRDHLVL